MFETLPESAEAKVRFLSAEDALSFGRGSVAQRHIVRRWQRTLMSQSGYLYRERCCARATCMSVWVDAFASWLVLCLDPGSMPPCVTRLVVRYPKLTVPSLGRDLRDAPVERINAHMRS